MLKIISGKYKGQKILFKFRDNTRPTSNLVKESLFNILQFDIVESDFLDLFCGSGQIGLEAISRGAKHVTFVDNDKYCNACLINNLKNMNILYGFEIIYQRVEKYLISCNRKFDIIFLDPPYNKGLPEKILPCLNKNINQYGIIVVETEKNEQLNNEYCNFKIYNEYVYGRKKITIYR